MATVSSIVQSKKDSEDTPAEIDILSLDQDDHDKLIPGLPLVDRITLGSIWFVSFVYSILTEHILSKQVDLPCSINHDIQTTFGILSILIAIIIPAAIGPIATTAIHLLISLSDKFLQTNQAPDEEVKKQERSNFVCILSLSVVFLFTYILSMVITELYIDMDNVFFFVIVKYIAGNKGRKK